MVTNKHDASIQTPILVLGYSRPDLLEGGLKRLTQAAQGNVWISIDGPESNNPEREDKQRHCAEIAKRYQCDPSKRRIATTNYGCRDGVIEGLTWFFSQNSRGIVLEDDIEIEYGYIEKMKDLLRRYENDKRIWSISSHCDPEMAVDAAGGNRFYLADLCRVWGWATWSDRWMSHQHWLNESANWNQIDCFWNLPKHVRSKEFALKIYACKKKHMHAWDYEWNLSHLRNSGKSITPLGLMSRNHGFREDGTHTKDNKPPWELMSNWQEKNQTGEDWATKTEEMDKILYENCGITRARDWKRESLELYRYLIYNRIAAPVRKSRNFLRTK